MGRNLFSVIKKFFEIIKYLKISKVFNKLIFFGSISILIEIFGLGLIPLVIISVLEPSIIAKFFLNLNFSFKEEEIAELILITFICTYALRFYLQIIVARQIIKSSEKVRYEISKEIFRHGILLNYSSFVKKNTGDYISSSIVQSSQVSNNFSDPLSSIIVELVTITMIVIALMYFNFKVSLFLVCFVIIAVLIYFFISRIFIRKLSYQRMTVEKNIFQYVSDTFNSIKEIKIFKLENFFSEKFCILINESTKIEKKHLFFGQLPKIWFELVIVSIICGLLFFVISLNYSNLEINTLLGTYVAAFFRILPGLNKISIKLQAMSYAVGSIEKIYKELISSKIDFSKTYEQINFNKYIFFKNIEFQYNYNGPIFFENQSFKIDKNDKIIINGDSGSGKSTFVSILSGLLVGKSNEINIDGIEKKIDSLKFNIGYVPQSVYLLDSSVLNNIILNKTFEENYFKDVIKTCELEFFLSNLSNLENTNIGDKGSLISGGQIQKIGLARALYRKPEILILDEATNSLDIINEKKIIENLLTIKDLTIIMVSHTSERDIYSLFNKKYLVKNKKISQIE